MPDGDLLGRWREIGAVEQLLAGVDMLPRAVVIEGEPGIGKTTLWLWSVDAARARDFTALQARPAEPEAQLVFAGLGDLFADAFAEIASLLPEPQRHALAAALLIGQPGETVIDQRTVGVALLSMVRLLAQKRPLLLAIDDEQWLDHASAAVLGFALRRLRTERVAVLLARRSALPGVAARSELETRLPTTRIHLGPLSMGALHAIVVERFGTVLARPRLRRLHELSRGNPFLAIELVRAAEAGRFRLDSAEPRLADLDGLLGTRLGALPAPTRTALLAAAALSHPRLDLVERLVVPGSAEAGAVLAPALDAGIVELADGDIRFTHPLLASAAYGAASATQRRRMHASLAGVIDDPVERARHAALAADEPDGAVATDVERAAMETFRRGAPDAAAELAELAVRLTPPSDVDNLRRRTAARAEYMFGSGDPAGATELLERLVAATPAGKTRAPLLALLSRIRHFGDDVETGVELGRRALAEARGDDGLAAGIHEGLAWGLLLMRADLPGAHRHARAAVRAARRSGDRIALAEGMAVEALASLAVGARSTDAIDAAMALEPVLMHLRVLRHPSFARGYLLVCTDELDAARSVFTELLERADDHGDESAVPPILVHLSTVEILAGSWDVAEAHARNGLALAVQVGQRPTQAALLSRQALLAALRGRLEEAATVGGRALELAGRSAELDSAIRDAPTRGGEWAVWALGAAALAASDFERAYRYLGPLAARLLDAGMREPGELRFLPDTAEALVGLGRIGDAEKLVATMEQTALRTQRSTALGLASRTRALLASAQGEQHVALTAAERAIELLDRGPLPFEQARSRLVLGELQRRTLQKRAARETLLAASRAFDDLGASGWASRARAEAARIGGRKASRTTLTPTETRVAELVRDGLANKEVAYALGITTKTVELHLSHIYAKLDVGSRTELVRRLTAAPITAAGEQNLGDSPVH